MSNPYLQSQQDAISNQVNTSLNTQQLPGIRRAAVAAGGYGGSRSGVAQGLAMNGANTAIANATANMQGQAYDADQNRATQSAMQAAQLASNQQIASMQDATNRFGMGNQFQLGQGQLGLGFQNSNNQNAQAMGQLGNQRYGMDQNFNLGQQNANTNQFQAQTSRDLGFGQLSNQQQGQNQNFYSQQRGQDLQQQGQGFNQYLQSLNAQMGLGQQMAGIGQQQFNAPGNVMQQYGQMLSPFTGLNGSNTTSTPGGGGGLAGAAGGALTMAQLWQMLNQQPRP